MPESKKVKTCKSKWKITKTTSGFKVSQKKRPKGLAFIVGSKKRARQIINGRCRS